MMEQIKWLQTKMFTDTKKIFHLLHEKTRKNKNSSARRKLQIEAENAKASKITREM
jgi:hypothetical protein